MQFPKARVMGLKRELAFEKQRRLEQEALIKDLRKELKKSCEINNEIRAINEQMQSMATSITDQLLPQTEKIMKLKKHAMDLHQKLGASQTELHKISENVNH